MLNMLHCKACLELFDFGPFPNPLRTRYVSQPLLEEMLWEPDQFHWPGRNPGPAVTQLARARFSGQSTHPTRMRVTITQCVLPQP